MKIFLDTGKIDEVKAAFATGLIDGVTTNPTLINKAGGDFEPTLVELCKLSTSKEWVVNGEVIATDAPGMVKEAETLAKLDPHLVIKIPMGVEGLKAVAELKKKGVRTNVTLVFSASQAFLAAKAGATYVSPFIGRLEDAGHDGMEVVREMREIFDNYEYGTQILVASIRSPRHVVLAAELGADVCTVPYDIFQKLFKHSLTDAGLKTFLADWDAYLAAKKK